METSTEEVQAPGTAVWRVYGIVPADTVLPDFPADDRSDELAERRFGLVVHGDVAAVVEPVDPDQRGRRRDLIAHSEMLNGLAVQVPVIPIAFGTAFETKEQVSDELLGPQESALASMLDELRGHVQFLLRVRYSMDDLLAQIVAGDGSIAALREETRALPEHEGRGSRLRLGELVSDAVDTCQAQDTDWLLTQFEPHAAGMHVTGRSTAEGTISIALLVHQPQRTAFEAAAEESAAVLRHRATVELLGPLAPFDFVPGREG